jgi:polyisoprenoid-binding protein YceI
MTATTRERHPTMTTVSGPTPSATRTLDGVELPHPGTYTIDPSHTNVRFVTRRLDE